MIVGVTGMFAAGKDTFADYLQRRGFRHLSLSDILREVMRAEGLELTIDKMTERGNALRRQYGAGELARRALARMEAGGDWIVTSIRHPNEARALRGGAAEFYLVFVDAPRAVRFERCRARGRAGDAATLEEFVAAEQRQLASGDEAAQQLEACRQSADVELSNGGHGEEFYRRIDAWLAALGGEKR